MVNLRNDLTHAMRLAAPVDWLVSEGLVPYVEAEAAMEARVEAISAGTAPELVWLLEHPALYTAGTSATDGDLTEARFPVFHTGAAVNIPITGRASGWPM